MESLVSGMSKSQPFAALLLLLLLGASLCSTIDATVAEGQALRILAQAWRNANFTTWISGGDPCGTPTWESVVCDRQGRVIRLNVTNRGLSGPIPDAIGSLTNLQVLDISNNGDSMYSDLPQNNFTGPLPASLFKLASLTSLNLSTIPWGLPFPSEISQLQNLEELELSECGLTGSIAPDFFTLLPKLRFLFLADNSNLSCNLADITNLGRLQQLSLYGITINTTIPADFADKLPNLSFLNLHDCFLYGALPDNFGNLKALQTLQLYNNDFSGYFPDTWKALLNLTNVRIHATFLSGQFPRWMLTDLPNLTQLYMDKNRFWGDMPPQSLLNNVKSVRLSCNYMNGIDPQANNYSDDNPYQTRYNCFNSASSSDLRKVLSECKQTHSLDCNDFYAQVVDRPSGCAPCPLNQFVESSNPINNPCVCGYTGGPKRSNGGVPVGAVVGGVLGLFIVFSLIVAFILWKRRKQFAWLDIFRSTRKDLGDWDPPQGVQRFSLEELAKITDNFSDSKVLGAGGFGKVFFGTLDDGRMVAIKRASPNSVQGLGEFRNEVILLSRLHHRHLVRLEGFCEEEGLEILVYEFMTNGNLHAHLLGKVTSTPLHWYKRLEIAVAVAQGLEYLHYYADPPVIHRDVKPSNILLDENMIAKLADFGISKATAEFDTHVSTKPAGTAGYLDPEYFLRRQLTTASDVYAYGVVLLELITGQEAIDHKRVEEFNLVEWVKKRFRTSGIVAVIDPLIDHGYPKEAYTVMTDLALQSASFNKDERPNMKVILATLEPYLVEYAQFLVPPKPRNKSRRSDSSAMSVASGSDTQGSVPTDPSYEAASAGLLALHPR